MHPAAFNKVRVLHHHSDSDSDDENFSSWSDTSNNRMIKNFEIMDGTTGNSRSKSRHATLGTTGNSKDFKNNLFSNINNKNKSMLNGKEPIDMNHDEMLEYAEIIFHKYDADGKEWLSKDETRMAYYEALSNKNVADEEFSYEFTKMDKNNDGQICITEWNQGFFRELMFATLDKDENGRVSIDEIQSCFARFHLDFESEEYEAFQRLFDSTLVDGEEDVPLEEFRQHIFNDVPFDSRIKQSLKLGGKGITKGITDGIKNINDTMTKELVNKTKISKTKVLPEGHEIW